MYTLSSNQRLCHNDQTLTYVVRRSVLKLMVMVIGHSCTHALKPCSVRSSVLAEKPNSSSQIFLTAVDNTRSIMKRKRYKNYAERQGATQAWNDGETWTLNGTKIACMRSFSSHKIQGTLYPPDPLSVSCSRIFFPSDGNHREMQNLLLAANLVVQVSLPYKQTKG